MSSIQRTTSVMLLSGSLTVAALVLATPAAADNKRLNESVFGNIYTAQKLNGCPVAAQRDHRLDAAAQRHALDLLNNRAIDGDIGSDGSTVSDRAAAAGFVGKVSETVAINPALAINGIEILDRWWPDPVARTTMQNCANISIGVWSENALDRTVVVAVYGQPSL